MARTLNEEEYAARRNEILDVAQQLIYTKGYEQMTIQDVLERLQISKGAFYHYFESKGDLLEAVVERMAAQIVPVLEAVVHDPSLNAIEKMQCYFDTSVRWKTNQKDFVIALLRVWYSDENAIVRQKIMNKLTQQISPMMTEIFRQGVEEGVFTLPYPEYFYQVNINLLMGLADSFAGLLLESEPEPDGLQRLQRTVDAYTDALERVLGCPPGTFQLIDRASVEEWFRILERANAD